MTRFDVSATEKTQLGSHGQFLKLHGPAYFMTTAPFAELNDVTKDADEPVQFGMRVKYEPNTHKLGYNSMARVHHMALLLWLCRIL